MGHRAGSSVCKDVLEEPFAVINADDYYGKEPFVKLHDYLISDVAMPEGVQPICMAGFVLGNTLSDNGGQRDARNLPHRCRNLIGIDETSNIVRLGDGAAVETEEGTKAVDVKSLVSMNMWGFQPEFLELLQKGFVEFLSKLDPVEAKGEYLLPICVDELLQAGKAQVRVLPTESIWFGVTYHEDKTSVVESFKKLIADGVYKKNLYE